MEHQPVGVEQVLQLLVGLGATSEPSAPASTALTPTLVRGAGAGATDEGSPRPRNRRTPSSSSAGSSSSNLGFPPLSSPSSTSALSLFPASSSTPASSRRRSALFTSISRSPHGAAGGTGAGRSLRRRATFEDLAALVHAQGGTYLGAGVGAEGPLGEGWSAEELAGKVRRTMGGKGPVCRAVFLFNSLAPACQPATLQLRAMAWTLSRHRD